MGRRIIGDCGIQNCPSAPTALGDSVGLRFCRICQRNVYNCSPAPGVPDWRRIWAPNDVAIDAAVSVGDVVRIGAGLYEGFDAIIHEINEEDDAALLSLNIFCHLPFWISLRYLHRIETAT